MPSREEDQVQRFCRGAPSAFEEIFAEHGGRVYRTCLRMCGNPDDAEDLTSETFLAAFQGSVRFEGRSSVSTWLLRIAYRKYLDLRGARKAVELPDDIASAPPGIIDDIDLWRAANELTDLQREAFYLVKVEGLRYREAAEVLDVPLTTIQTRVHDAVVRLRELLREHPVAKEGNGSI